MSELKPDSIWITGAGAISPLGHDAATLYAALLGGETGVGPFELFDPAPIPVGEAGEIRFDAGEHLGKGRNLRPLDRTARLVTIAARSALADAGLEIAEPADGADDAEEAPGVGLVLGTMFGSVHTIAAFDRRAITAGPAYAKPLEFANSVINAAAGQTAIWHRLRGVSSTITGGPTAALAAIAYAADRLRQGRDAAVLAGGGEELCFESFSAFYQAGHLAAASNGTPARPVPLDAGRNGFALAEGSALLVLERAETARERGVRPLGRVLGHGAAFDPSRGRDAESGARAVARAVHAALADAEIEPAAIDLVSLSASGRVDGDRIEAAGLAAVFGERLADVPVLASKANLGETLGAAGAFQMLAALEARRHDRLPGVRGLETLDADSPWRDLGADARPIAWPDGRGARVLVHALGLDGATQALIVDTLPEETLAETAQ